MKIYDFEGQKNISGDRIHQVRATKRISQADLAARMQVKGVFIEREAMAACNIKCERTNTTSNDGYAFYRIYFFTINRAKTQ